MKGNVQNFSASKNTNLTSKELTWTSQNHKISKETIFRAKKARNCLLRD